MSLLQPPAPPERAMRRIVQALHSRSMSNDTTFARLSADCRAASATIADSVIQIQGRPRHPATALVIGPERLVTTSHSVEWDDDIQVRHRDQVLRGSVAGRDAVTDLVLLRVPGLNAPAIQFADRSPATGELALIVARGWGGHLKARLTTVSTIDGPIRAGRGRTLAGVLNLDTAPYTGFSGSAVLLPDGRVGGISTTGLLRGVGLALGVETIGPLLAALERDGGIQRGYLGVTSQPVSVPESQRAGGEDHGLLIVGIAEGAPAAEAGLLVGDILVGVDGRPVSDPEHLLTRLTADRVGSPLALRVIRGRHAVDVSVVVGRRPSS